jgi:conjugative relaxase-like TrwC/TraI family protein
MLKITPITDIFYLTGSELAPKNGLGPTDAKLESPGEWWCPCNWIAVDRQIAPAITVVRLSQGRHPKTQRRMIIGMCDKRRPGYDLTFSPPKGWTVLWAISNAQGRAILDAMLIHAVRESLDAIAAAGLIEARVGKGGKKREPMARLVAVLFRHRTSRKGDPQAHVHAALLNIGMRHDGKVRAINNEKLCADQKSIGAAFRLRLAEKLEAIGVPVQADLEHGFKIKAQPVKLVDIWSKRRKQIVHAAYTNGLDGTAGHLRVVDRLVKQTRSKKIELPAISVLEARWQVEARDAGWHPLQEWCRLDRPMIVRSPRQNEDAATAIVAEVLAHISRHRSIFRRGDVESMALTLAVGRSSLNAMQRIFDAAIRGSEIIDLKRNGYLTTQTVINQEKEIVQICRQRQSRTALGFSDADLRYATAGKRSSDARMDAIEHALSNHGVSAVEIVSGMDNKTVATALSQACQHNNRRLIVVAPPRVTEENADIESPRYAHTFDFDQFLHALEVGKIRLRITDVVIIDRASMLDVAQALSLLRSAHRCSAKIIFQDDINRIVPDDRSDLFALIIRAIGSQQIRTIGRQQSEWQRGASVTAYRGEIGRALQTYADREAVTIANDRQTALTMMVAAFAEMQGDAVAVTTTNREAARINAVFRYAAREVGIIGEKDIIIRAIPLSSKGRPEPVDLLITQNDRLIVGRQCTIGNVVLEHLSLLAVKSVFPSRYPHAPDQIELLTAGGQLLVTNCAELAQAGKDGRPVAMQHAYCLTTRLAQGLTWKRTLWLTSHEDERSALVALTRHCIDLMIFIDRSAHSPFSNAPRVDEHRGMVDSEQGPKSRKDRDLIATLGKFMERLIAPRNALDALSLRVLRMLNMDAPPISTLEEGMARRSQDHEQMTDWTSKSNTTSTSELFVGNQHVERIDPPALDDLAPGM